MSSLTMFHAVAVLMNIPLCMLYIYNCIMISSISVSLSILTNCSLHITLTYVSIFMHLGVTRLSHRINILSIMWQHKLMHFELHH